MYYYSKSKYVTFYRCHKLLWLLKYKPDEGLMHVNEAAKINGNLVGDLAMGLFGDYYLAEDKENDLNKQVENTKEAIERKERIICEASFFFENNYCAVDILRRNDDGTFDIFEVKSSTAFHEHYYHDMAYQYYVLSNLGLKINTVNLVHVNNKYVYDGNFDLNQYFKIEDSTEKVLELSKLVKDTLNEADKILSQEEEPKSEFSSQCSHFGGCPFFDYCKKSINACGYNSLFELYNSKNKYKFINEGIITFNDYIKTNPSLSLFQARQIDFEINERKDTYIDKEKVKEILDSYEYPLYFFDFETYQDSVPRFKGTKPYQQITFQYSLHIMDRNHKLVHKEFIGNGVDDPRKALMLKMIEDLSDKGTIIAYNMSFEKGRITELKDLFPEYEDKLNSILERFKDLYDIFGNGYVYNKDMHGSLSIKSVLPALFPDDESLNYHNLNQVHKGDEASQAYLTLKTLDEKSKKELVKNMLKYCELDTYAMVKIYLKLYEMVS